MDIRVQNFKEFPTLIEAENFIKGELNYNTNKQIMQKKRKIKDDIEEILLSKNPHFKETIKKISSPPLLSSPELKELLTEKKMKHTKRNKTIKQYCMLIILMGFIIIIPRNIPIEL